MSDSRLPRVLLVVHLVACGPRPPPSAESTAPPATAAPAEPAAETTAPAPSSEKEIGGWVLGSLLNAGYRCTEDSPTQMCMTADDSWVVHVTTRVESDRAYVLFDSFATRTPWPQCGPLNSQLTPLRSEPTQFSVSCLDSTQRIRMSTAVVYSPELQVPAWMEQHRRSRYDASQRLGSLTTVSR